MVAERSSHGSELRWLRGSGLLVALEGSVVVGSEAGAVPMRTD